MNGTCPGCGMHGPFEIFMSPVDAGHVAALMGKVPPEIADLVLRYVGLFAPAKHKLTAARGRRVLGELVSLIEARKVSLNRREWPAPITSWESAITEMLDRRANLTLPLKSHGYLIQVVVGLADKQEAKAENETERKRREGVAMRPVQTSPEPAPITAIDFARIRRETEEREAKYAALKKPAAPPATAIVVDKAARLAAEEELQQRQPIAVPSNPR